ncbi:MAG: hypothetical protein PUF66_05545 [Clostridium sp.]|nr:hypothetical protein [Clostridium sp.]
MRLGMILLFFFLYLGIIFLSVMGFKKKNKKLKIVSISLLVLAIIFTTIIVIIYG